MAIISFFCISYSLNREIKRDIIVEKCLRRKELLNKTIIFFLCFLLLFSIPIPVFATEIPDSTLIDSPQENQELQEAQTEIYEAKVIHVKEEVLQDQSLLSQGFEEIMQVVTIQILEGPFQGEEHTIEHFNMENAAYSLWVKEGDKVQIYAQLSGDQSEIESLYISDFVRYPHLRNLAIVFILLVILIGKWQGVKSLIGLGVTTAIVIFFMLPMILKGYSPILLAVLVCILSTVISILLISGFSKKSFTTIIGTLSGVLIAGVLSYFVGNAANLTGMSAHETQMLIYIPQEVELDFKGLLFAGIIIGALGAVMDVAMSISSSMEEIKGKNPDIPPRELMKSGLVVGKDIMGTMSNTLILAYVGSSIPLLLLFMAYESSLISVINMDLVATEIVRALTGSIGLLTSIPITALTYGLLTRKKSK